MNEETMDPNTYVSQLINKINIIQTQFIAFFASRQFESYIQQVNPWVAQFEVHPHRPEINIRLTHLSPSQEREQKKIKSDFNNWQKDFGSVLEYISGDKEIRLQSLIRKLDLHINYPKASGSPKTFNETIESFKESCVQIEDIINDFESLAKCSPVYVLDTSTILECPDVSQISSSINATGIVLVIPSTTLRELEELKTGKRDEAFRRKLTAANKNLDEIASQGDPLQGVKLSSKTIIKFVANEPDFSDLPEWLDPKINDDRILASTLELQKINPFSKITLIANDLSMKNKARLANIFVMKGPDYSDYPA